MMDTSRRNFIKNATLAAGTFLLSGSCTSVTRNDKRKCKRPNLVYVLRISGVLKMLDLREITILLLKI